MGKNVASAPARRGRNCQDSGRRDVRSFVRLIQSLLRSLFSRQTLWLALQAAVILAISFATAFGVLVGTRSPIAHYDPYLFAVGTAGMVGAACGGMSLLVASRLRLRAQLRTPSGRIDELSDR